MQRLLTMRVTRRYLRHWHMRSTCKCAAVSRDEPYSSLPVLLLEHCNSYVPYDIRAH